MHYIVLGRIEFKIGLMMRKERTIRLLSQIQFRLHNNILQEVSRRSLVKTGRDLHDKGSHQQDASKAIIISAQLPQGGNVLNHISEFKDIIFDLAAMLSMTRKMWI